MESCPTTEMNRDFFTKPNQGSLFCKFRDRIMGLIPPESPEQNHRSVLESDNRDGEHVWAKLTKNTQSGELHVSTSKIGKLSYADVVKAGNRICSSEGDDLRKSPEVDLRQAPVSAGRPLFPGNLNRLGNKWKCEAQCTANACKNLGIAQKEEKRQKAKNGIAKIGKNHSSEK